MCSGMRLFGFLHSAGSCRNLKSSLFIGTTSKAQWALVWCPSLVGCLAGVPHWASSLGFLTGLPHWASSPGSLSGLPHWAASLSWAASLDRLTRSSQCSFGTGERRNSRFSLLDGRTLPSAFCTEWPKMCWSQECLQKRPNRSHDNQSRQC